MPFESILFQSVTNCHRLKIHNGLVDAALRLRLDYKAQTPWEAEREFAEYFDGLAAAYFISPIVDLERIEGVTLDEEHLRYVWQHPTCDWRVPTHILYGENDNLTSLETISDFARRTGATLEVMPGGEHWFHTPEQMEVLRRWTLTNLEEDIA